MKSEDNLQTFQYVQLDNIPIELFKTDIISTIAVPLLS